MFKKQLHKAKYERKKVDKKRRKLFIKLNVVESDDFDKEMKKIKKNEMDMNIYDKYWKRYGHTCKCTGCSGLTYSRSKFKRLAKKKGKNKGKSSLYVRNDDNYNYWFLKKECKNEDLILPIRKDKSFKKNMGQKEDDLCTICFTNQKGNGSFVMKKCDHGTLMCYSCALKVDMCPFCRIPR